MDIFVSVGRIATERQRIFLEALEKKLISHELQPRTIGRNTFTSGQPLEKIKTVMRRCRGLVVLAFERTQADSGREVCGIEEPPQEFENRRYVSPWHQIEMAMACMLDLPPLVIVERGVFEEGLLEEKHGWFIYRTECDVAELYGEELNGILQEWLEERVKKVPDPDAMVPVSEVPEVKDVTGVSVGAMVKGMTPKQLWGVATTIAALLVSTFTFGAWSSKVLDAASGSTKQVQASTLPTAQPQDAEMIAKVREARTLLRQGNYTQARLAFELALTLAPEARRTHTNVAAAKDSQRRGDEATAARLLAEVFSDV